MATVTGAGGLIVPAGETRSFVDETGFLLSPQPSSPTDTLVVRGTVDVSQGPGASLSSLIGVSVEFGSMPPANAAVTIESGGVLQVAAARTDTFLQVFGFYGRTDVDLVNHGAVRVSGVGPVVGAFNSDNRWELRNTGDFTVTSNGGEATGVITPGGFHNSGTFTVVGQTKVVAVDVTFPTSVIYNSGTIRASNNSPTVDSIAMLIRPTSVGGAHLVNDGRIEGEIALQVLSGPIVRGPALYTNNGALVGKVLMGDPPSRLVNTGTIEGDVTFGGLDDVYDGSLGQLAGRLSAGAGNDLVTGGGAAEKFAGDAGADTVAGGAGADTIDGGAGRSYLRGDEGNDSVIGGADFDDINGNMGDDTASGGLGTDWVVGGKDSDLLFGDAGEDIVYGNLGADTCDGGDGNDIVRGGQDDDLVRGGAGDDFVSGDRGADTMAGGLGADVFHTFGEAGVDRVTDFNLAEGDRVHLDPGTEYTLAQVGADTAITMTGGGQMVLVGVQMASLAPGWIFGA